MELENTVENRMIRQVVASMAIENMYVSKDFILELQKLMNGEKTIDQLIQEIIDDSNRR